MPRIRLLVSEETPVAPYRYRDPANPTAGVFQIPVLRLSTLARIEPRPGTTAGVSTVTAIIDTGAWLSAIETSYWNDYERAGLLEHLPFEGAATRSAAIGGLATAYQLGRVWVSLHELRLGRPPRVLPAVPVIAQLLLNPRCQLPSPLVLGFHLGVLDGRKLTRRVVLPRPSPLSTDRGSQYGQDWYLETA